jgi:hypothetical protein
MFRVFGFANETTQKMKKVASIATMLLSMPTIMLRRSVPGIRAAAAASVRIQQNGSVHYQVRSLSSMWLWDNSSTRSIGNKGHYRNCMFSTDSPSPNPENDGSTPPSSDDTNMKEYSQLPQEDQAPLPFHPSRSRIPPAADRGNDASSNSKILSKRILVSGLSRFASRIDALKVIGDIQAEMIEPVIDPAYFPTGTFVVTCKTTDDAGKLMNRLRRNTTNDLIRPVTVTPLQHVDYSKIFTTKKAKISMRTLRVEILNAYCTREDILFFFRDFRIVTVLGLDYLSKNAGVSGMNLFLVDFESAEEAERALQEKINQVMFVGSVRLIWYNC